MTQPENNILGRVIRLEQQYASLDRAVSGPPPLAQQVAVMARSMEDLREDFHQEREARQKLERERTEAERERRAEVGNWRRSYLNVMVAMICAFLALASTVLVAVL